MITVARATDSIHRLAGMVGGLRSDYANEWSRADYDHAIANGWKHFDDEPDLMYLDTPNAMHTLHFGGRMGTWHTIQNPEGVSKSARRGSVREIVDDVAERERTGRGWGDYPKYGYQERLVNQMREAMDSGDQDAEREARANLARDKASEEAIGLGGSNLYDNLGRVLRARGLM